jgi:alpha-L-fucosidase 2
MKSALLLAGLSLVVLVGRSGAQQAPREVLFYHHPAPEWNQALPLGNGRLGAMVFGNVNGERIQLNENTLWMGGPRDTVNPEALPHLNDVRRLLFAGMPVEAYTVAEKHLMGRPFRLESYQSLGDLRLTFEHEGTPADYRFELDLETAIARLSYRHGGVRYTREVFVSHPAQAIVMRLTADTPGTITVSTWIDRVQDATTEVVGRDRLNLVGALGGGKGLSFLASVKLIAEGGHLDAFPERLHTQNANALTLIVTGATSYHGRDHRRMTEQSLKTAAAVPYERLKAEHIADHQRLFRRVALHLGSAQRPDPLASLPTDERLDRVKKGGMDLGLDALYFQFGRYLLIASSRPGGLPANLQGLWNDSMSPPWDSDYHLNINLQMNYWPAEVTNLAELHEPLFDFLESLRESGRKTAREHCRRAAAGIRVPAGQTVVAVSSGGRDVAIRQHGDAAEVAFEAGRAYRVRFQ